MKPATEILQGAIDALMEADNLVTLDGVPKAIESLRELLARSSEPVAIPDDVRKVAKAMQGNGYRGPLSFAVKVIDFVADYAQPTTSAQPLDAETLWRKPWDETVKFLIHPDSTLEHVFYLGFRHGITASPEKAAISATKATSQEKA